MKTTSFAGLAKLLVIGVPGRYTLKVRVHAELCPGVEFLLD
jgi:hypothetical protein